LPFVISFAICALSFVIIVFLLHYTSRLHLFIDSDYRHPILVGSGQYHTLALDAAQDHGIQIIHHHDLFSDKVLFLVVVPDPRDDLFSPVAKIEYYNIQLIRVRMVIYFLDPRYLKLQLLKIFKCRHLPRPYVEQLSNALFQFFIVVAHQFHVVGHIGQDYPGLGNTFYLT